MDGKDMRTARRNKTAVIAVAAIILAAVLIIILCIPEKKEPDPHEGQVYINDGFGMVWMTPLEGVDVNDLTQADISSSGGKPLYHGDKYEVKYGVDVSEHQWDIDWQQAAGSLDFAMIRLGYRGYTEGGLFEDPYYKANMTGALANGLDVGVYFFSQAINVQEAIEEAEFVLERLEGYDVRMPVVFDWEKIETDSAARTDGMDPTVLTDCAVAFCQTVKNAGYDACVYFNRHFGYYEFDLSRLTDYQFWVALPGEFPDFYYKCELWQYSFTESIPGIEGETDMNMLFIPVATEPVPVEGERK